MLYFNLDFYSSALRKRISVPLAEHKLALAIPAAAMQIPSTASDAFPVSLWVNYGPRGASHTTTVGELRLRNGIKGLPQQPLLGDWRKDATQIVASINSQYDARTLADEAHHVFAQLYDLLIVSKTVTLEEGEVLCDRYEQLRRVIHKHTPHPTDLQSDVRQAMYALHHAMPNAIASSFWHTY